MNNDKQTDSQDSSTPKATGFSPWQQLKGKRISYLTLPLLIMATVTEFVILATGWKYQQVVCVPKGMGVTFFGIGPIGATILAVELLKLPLAIWTASRTGWQKSVMVVCGLPLICLLTFQLVKDMAVYEMGVAMTPASQMLEKATDEETKIAQLNNQLKAIEGKKSDRETKLAELASKKAKARTELEESIKRNEEARQDAISLTDYQKKELSEVDARQATIIKQFNADTEQLTKSLTELRARRDTELPRATKWNAEEARIDNAYKTKMADYANKKAAYEKDKTEYDNASFLKRQVLKEPITPGVPPVREVNTILKPGELAELDSQIKAKEAELLAVNNKRRDRLAQVDTDARRLREEFDHRSTAKREESDRKREALSAAQLALANEFKAEEKLIDQNLDSSVQKVDGIHAELDAAQKRAEGYYEAREASIRNTQVHRIATTVEIVRGLVKGERPVSIKATAKERGDLLTDQISMVRIWVYPVLAFIVAFLPTLMVEIGFSTVFHPEKARPAYRLGLFGRHLHWLYKRAGHQKIYRAERLAREASAEIVTRDKALTAAKVAGEKALAAKQVEINAAQEAFEAAAAAHVEQLQKQENEWQAKLADVTDTLNTTVAEKDNLRDFQQAEIERQVLLRQNAWSDRLSQLRTELDSQRAKNETERLTTAQENQKKLVELSEDWRNQIVQAGRQLADVELAAEEKLAKLTVELKEAVNARDAAASQSHLQSEAVSLKLTQVKEEALREAEKTARQEKHRAERQQAEFAKNLRQANEEFEHQLKQREQELTSKFDAHLADEQTRTEQDARRREVEFERQVDARVREVEARWKQEVQQREDAAQIRLKQHEKQLQAQTDIHLRDMQTQAEEQLRRRELEFDRQLDARAREIETRVQDELQQKELGLHETLKQREQALNSRAIARETDLQNQWAADLRTREKEWGQQSESRIRAIEARLAGESQQKEDGFQEKMRQRELQLQSQFEALQVELQTQWNHELRQRELEAAEAKQREQALTDKLAQQTLTHQRAEKEWKKELETACATIEPLKSLLARTEMEWDMDMQSASAAIRHVQDLKKKLNETSSALNGWKSAKSLVGGKD